MPMDHMQPRTGLKMAQQEIINLSNLFRDSLQFLVVSLMVQPCSVNYVDDWLLLQCQKIGHLFIRWPNFISKFTGSGWLTPSMRAACCSFLTDLQEEWGISWTEAERPVKKMLHENLTENLWEPNRKPLNIVAVCCHIVPRHQRAWSLDQERAAVSGGQCSVTRGIQTKLTSLLNWIPTFPSSNWDLSWLIHSSCLVWKHPKGSLNTSVSLKFYCMELCKVIFMQAFNVPWTFSTPILG